MSITKSATRVKNSFSRKETSASRFSTVNKPIDEQEEFKQSDKVN